MPVVSIYIFRQKTEGGDGAVRFVPSSPVPIGVRVYWCNMDPLAEHHIDLFPDEPTYILKRYTGEPPDRTPEFVVSRDFKYSCKLHQTETGELPAP